MKLLGVNLGLVGIILGGALAMGPGAPSDAFACTRYNCATQDEPTMPGSRSTDVAEGASSGGGLTGCPKSPVNVGNEQQAAGQSLIVACTTLNCAAPQEERLKLVGEIQSDEASALRSLNRGPVACTTVNCAAPQEERLQRTGEIQVACSTLNCATSERDKDQAPRGTNIEVACLSDQSCFAPDDESKARSGFASASATTKAAASSALFTDDCLR